VFGIRLENLILALRKAVGSALEENGVGCFRLGV